MFSISIIGGRVRITANTTGQEVWLKRADILELQREINIAFPEGESPVRQAAKMELLDVARQSNDAQARIDACRVLLENFPEQMGDLPAYEVPEPKITMLDKKIAELQQVCASVIAYLERFHPHTTVLITNSEIKLDETQMFIPVR